MKKIKIKYDSVITIENIECIYKKIKRNVRNKNKIILFEDYYSSNISKVYEVLKNKSYDGGKYYLFSIYEPKKRLIMNQGMNDKIINHFISEYYLRNLEKSMINSNVATRKGKGTKLGVTLLKKYFNELKNKNFYILKCDIEKYFYSISHRKLKEMLEKKYKDCDILVLLNQVIDSFNHSYVKEYCKKNNFYYKNGYGLPIG